MKQEDGFEEADRVVRKRQAEKDGRAVTMHHVRLRA
jgi:hypothetical protein